MSQKQSLIILISRLQLDPNLIPPLKLIIPMLSNLYPVRIFTSADGQIHPTKTTTVYEQLVRRLEGQSGYCNINQVLKSIMAEFDQRNSRNYRICIIGQDRVDWRVIMDFKRRAVVIDTVCGAIEKNLIQISYITQGINKTIKQNNMIKIFQTELGMNSKMRHQFKVDKKQTVQFSLKCSECSNEIKNSFVSCSVCLAAYCQQHEKIKQCSQCQSVFD